MNPVSQYLVENMVPIFFLYGLAFFVMGLALALARPRESRFEFSRAIRPLAAFGILHGAHEWFEMFQRIATQACGHTPTFGEELVRLVILGVSFVMLAGFGISLMRPAEMEFWRRYRPLVGLLSLWLGGIVGVVLTFNPTAGEFTALIDVVTRYSLGIPAALLGTWAFMSQQHVFRRHAMPQFGRDLVWCASAMFLYGVVGQLFVRQTALFPSTLINSDLFLAWFGIPVQLFRGMMAGVLTFYMVRVLRAFDLESQQRLEQANQARIAAQTAALEAERGFSHNMEKLNTELRLTAQELLLLLDLSNLLAMAAPLPERLHQVLEKIIDSLHFPEAGMILLVQPDDNNLEVQVSSGFPQEANGLASAYELALQLGKRCVASGLALCRHLDGEVIRFSAEDEMDRQRCRAYQSPVCMLGLPLIAQQRGIGCIILAQPEPNIQPLTVEEFTLMTGIAQQLGLSIENALLYQEAQAREKQLGELLHQVVTAQETERKRIARELHDATGQSLTAVALGLRGVEGRLGGELPEVVEQIRALKSFSTSALGELRQLISDLRPPQLDDLGLVEALEWYVQTFEKRHRIVTELKIEGEPVRLPWDYETVLFRIAQEALANVAKHAEAKQVRVKLVLEASQIRLTIEDDGRGFEPKEVMARGGQTASWGLLGIRERTLLLGGEYEVNSKPGNGTQIRVWIPLNEVISHVKD